MSGPQQNVVCIIIRCCQLPVGEQILLSKMAGLTLTAHGQAAPAPPPPPMPQMNGFGAPPPAPVGMPPPPPMFAYQQHMRPGQPGTPSSGPPQASAPPPAPWAQQMPPRPPFPGQHPTISCLQVAYQSLSQSV